MMASAKKKQDEKNLKVLRELVSQPCNKECFDCRQRGPTYVNMTIGSFVCTSCSGILRGLTPPQRVKSISMATFTQVEINFIKQRGNKYCERIWLGLMNPGESLSLDTKDEQKIRDLMRLKYELKKYYLEPSAADQNQHDTKKCDNSTTNSVIRIPTPSPVSNPARKLNDADAKNTNEFITNFVADFSKISDSFSSNAISEYKFDNTLTSQASFANFDNNPAFVTPKSITETQFPLYSNTGGSGVLNINEADAPPSEDRYAALKDLDSLMKQTKLNEGTTMNTPKWNPSNSNISNSIWGMETQTTHLIPNPFSSSDQWQPTTNIFNNNVYSDTSLSNSANPFKSAQASVEPDMIGVDPSNITNVIQLSQMRAPLNKVWQSTLPAHHANPFLVRSRTNVTNNSNNPFL